MAIQINGNGTITGISVGGLPDGIVDTDMLANTVTTGKILQVKQTVKTDTWSSTAASFTDISGMSLSITPTSTSNKILIDVTLNYGGTSNVYAALKVLRDSTTVVTSTAVAQGNQINGSFAANTIQGSNSNYKVNTAAFKFLDSPSSTSALTYKVQVYVRDNETFNINRPNNNDNDNYIMGGTSSITAMEVAA